jgi:hypothetical protein
MKAHINLFKRILHLHNKWVKIMILASIISIIGIILLIPGEKKEIPILVKNINTTLVLADSVISTNKSEAPDSIQTQTQLDMNAKYEKSSATLRTQSVHAKKSGWKSTFIWIIGAVNGLVVLALNVKKLLAKTPVE